MKVLLSKQATKFINKHEKAIQRRIFTALKGLEEIPPIGDIKKLKGIDETYRLRIGTYRVIYNVDFQSEVVKVSIIENRGVIY